MHCVTFLFHCGVTAINTHLQEEGNTTAEQKYVTANIGGFIKIFLTFHCPVKCYFNTVRFLHFTDVGVSSLLHAFSVGADVCFWQHYIHILKSLNMWQHNIT